MMARDETGTIRAIVGIATRDSANVLQTIDTAYARDAVLTRRTVFSSLAVTISPDHLNATGYSPGTVSPWTGFCTASPTGGTAPYRYAWTVDNSWGVLNPTSASTAFQSIPLSPGDGSDATGTITVTDANSLTATATIPLTSYNSHF